MEHSVVLGVVLRVSEQHAIVRVGHSVPRVVRVRHVGDLSKVEHRGSAVHGLVVSIPVASGGVVCIFHGLCDSLDRVGAVARPAIEGPSLGHIIGSCYGNSRVISNTVGTPLFIS